MICIQRTSVIFSAGWLVGILSLTPAHGCQVPADPQLSALTVTVKAYIGQPFGVGIATVTETHRESWWGAPDPVRLQILGADAFYPVIERTGSQAGKSHQSDELRIYFLFHANRPATISVIGKSYPLEPANDVTAHRDALNHWWRWFAAQADANRLHDKYPAQIEQYLVHMLSRRLQLEVPKSSPLPYAYDSLEYTTGFLTGTEAVRVAMQKDALLGTSRRNDATEALPKAILPPVVAIPEPSPNVEIESIASAVPHECFYARFTRYEDLIWFGDLIDEWGTELNSYATDRGLKYDIHQRVQDQLNVHESEFAKLLSSAVVKDYAIIGTDTFLREGAGIGILFHAASNELLQAWLVEQRRQCAAQGDGVTLSDVPFEGLKQTASLLISTDNRVRSLYVASGDFHLVTTSRTIARRFLETRADGTTSLGASKEFRYARTVTPVSRDDTAFIYLSDQFFRTFAGPAFRIEMTRRAASESEIELAQLAILAAKSEQCPHSTIDELIAGGFLPTEFQKRADGSRLVLKDGDVTDSQRGARGAFIPVADVSVGKVTTTEVSQYGEFARKYRRIWTGMDPATLAMQRHVKDKQERLVLDLHMYPCPQGAFFPLGFLGPVKTQKRIAPIPGTIVTAEGNFRGMGHAFAGLADVDTPIVMKDYSIDQWAYSPESIGAFIGGVRSSIMSWFVSVQDDLRIGEIVPNEDPSAEYLGMTLGYTDGEFDALTGSRDVMELLVGRLSLIDAERPADLRVHLGDLARSKLRRFVNAKMWTSANGIAQGHIKLLNRMVTQFHVAPENTMDALEQILQARLVCPFGGDYPVRQPTFYDYVDSSKILTYTHPLLKRLRGAEFELTIDGTTLISHAEVLLDLP